MKGSLADLVVKRYLLAKLLGDLYLMSLNNEGNTGKGLIKLL